MKETIFMLFVLVFIVAGIAWGIHTKIEMWHLCRTVHGSLYCFFALGR